MVEAEKRARQYAEQQAETAAKARELAERQAKATAQENSEARRKAQAEAEANAKLAEQAVAKAQAIAQEAARAKATAEAKAEAERKARAEAEDRAKAEAVARVMSEQSMRAKAEDDVKMRVIAELKARELAQVEEDARYRQEATARARASADERRKREEDSRHAAESVRGRKPRNWPKSVGIVLGLLIVVAVALLHFIPLTGYIAGARQVMSARLGVPVEISELRYALLPSPQLTLQGVALGALQEVKIASIVVRAGPLALLSDSKQLDEVEVNNLTADQDALTMAERWAAPAPGNQTLAVRKLRLKGVKLALREFDAPLFDGEITIGTDGAVQRAQLSATGLRVDLTQKDKTWRATIDGRNYQAPLGPALTFDDINVVAVFGPKQATLTTIEGRAGRGVMKGTAKATWASGIRMDGEFSITGGDLGQLMTAFTRDFSATGTVSTNATFALQGASLKTLFADPKLEATFTIERGELNNVDIVRAIQSPSRDGVRGGKTRFESLAGAVQASDKQFSYRKLQLGSGPMNATGNVDIAANGDLSGRVSAELGSKTVVVARGNLNVTGNLKTPVLKQ
jgi:hypothetical protein